MRLAEDRTPHLARQARIRPYQQPNELDRCATDRPFRFKAPDYAVDGDEHEFASPRTEQTRRHVQFFTPPAKMQPLQQQMRTDPAAASGALLTLASVCFPGSLQHSTKTAIHGQAPMWFETSIGTPF